MPPDPTTGLTLQQQKNIILSSSGNFCTDTGMIFLYVRHFDFGIKAIQHLGKLLQASLQLYRLKNDTNEVERACIDLATS